MLRNLRKLGAKMLFLVILSMFLVDYVAFAAEEGEREAKITEFAENIRSRPVTECQLSLEPAMEYAQETYLVFLNENFLNKSSNSTLTNIAIARYDEYKKELEAYFSNLEVGLSTAGILLENENEIKAYEQCQQLVDHYKDLGKDALKTHVISTSSDKKTTIFLEKYQAINSELSAGNQEIAKTYGYFITFTNKLPFFLDQCLKP